MYFFFLSVVLLIQTETEKPTIVNKGKIKQKKMKEKKKEISFYWKLYLQSVSVNDPQQMKNDYGIEFYVVITIKSKLPYGLWTYATLWYLCFLFYIFLCFACVLFDDCANKKQQCSHRHTNQHTEWSCIWDVFKRNAFFCLVLLNSFIWWMAF